MIRMQSLQNVIKPNHPIDDQDRVPKTSLARWHCQPESFCASGKFLRVFTKLPIKCSLNINRRVNKCGNFSDCLESFKAVWKILRQSGKFPDSLESFQTVWKVSRQCGKFPDSEESSVQSEKFPEIVESFRTVWIVFRQSGKFPDSVESFRTVWKVLDSLKNFQTVWKA